MGARMTSSKWMIMMMWYRAICLHCMLSSCDSLSGLQPGQIPIVLSRQPTSTFTKIESSAPFPVFVNVNSHASQSISLTGLNRTILDWTETTVDKNGILRIKFNPPTQDNNLGSIMGGLGNNGNGFSIFGSGVIQINGVTFTSGNTVSADQKDAEVTVVTNTSPTALMVDGSGNMEVLAPITTSALSLSAAGAGDLLLPKITVDTLQAAVTGTGAITVSGGSAGTANIAAHGTGNFDGETLHTSNTNAIVSGSGTVTVTVSDQLMGSIAGMGAIKYHGNPTVSVQTTGLGSVKKL